MSSQRQYMVYSSEVIASVLQKSVSTSCPVTAGIPDILSSSGWYTLYTLLLVPVYPKTVKLCETPNKLCCQSLCTLCILSCHHWYTLYTVMSPGTHNKLCCQCLYTLLSSPVYPTYRVTNAIILSCHLRYTLHTVSLT